MSVLAVAFHLGYAWSVRGALLHGLLLVALKIALVGTVFAVTVGLLMAVARMSTNRALRWLATAYINIFRGVPIIVSALWVYFGLSQATGINFSLFVAGVLALGLLYSAINAEIFRAALEAVPQGQRDAGLALGMTRARIFFWVVLPQATKIAIPNIGSMLIAMIKDTSVLFIIGVNELVATVQSLGASSYQYFTLYTAAAMLYVAVAFTVDFLFRTLEKTMQVPPRGPLARAATGRRRRRVEAVAARAH